jgi:hypothetical protein
MIRDARGGYTISNDWKQLDLDVIHGVSPARGSHPPSIPDHYVDPRIGHMKIDSIGTSENGVG